MFEIIFNFIATNYPQIALYMVIGLILIILTYKGTVFYTKTKKLHDDMPVLQSTLLKIDRGLVTLNTVLLEKTIISQSCYSAENSPRTINPLGIELLRDSGADRIFEVRKDDLISELESKNIHSLLELEKESLNVMLSHRDESEYKSLQDFAFEHPTFKQKPLTYTDMLFLVALKLRDFYRERHRELDEGQT